ncbi:MAG: hypothetical protein ACJ768_09600 [Gaiellaceae bacterium]
MKERKGPFGRTVDMVADTVAGTVRRRRQGRMPRALVYDADGHPRLVPPGSGPHERMVELAESLVALAIEERGGEPDPAEDPLEE